MQFFLLVLATLASCATTIEAQDYTPVPGGLTGKGTTTQIWNCCKGTCLMPLSPLSDPIKGCTADGVSSSRSSSVCMTGSAYMCDSQQPIQRNASVIYGFAAFGNLTINVVPNTCCKCFQLSYEDGPNVGKHIVVQVISNTDSRLDKDPNNFQVFVPGAAYGSNSSACASQYNDQYQEATSKDQCNQMPPSLKQGCQVRFDAPIMDGNITFVEVTCPDHVTFKSGCK